MGDRRDNEVRAELPGRLSSRAARRFLLLGCAFLALIIGLAGTLTVQRLAAQEAAADSQAAAPPEEVAVALHVTPVVFGDDTFYVLTLAAAGLNPDGAVVTFPNGQLYDFVVLQDGREIWRWSQGRVFHQAVVQQAFPFGDLQLFSAVWDGRGEDGDPVQGEVEARAYLAAAAPIEAAPVTIPAGL